MALDDGRRTMGTSRRTNLVDLGWLPVETGGRRHVAAGNMRVPSTGVPAMASPIAIVAASLILTTTTANGVRAKTPAESRASPATKFCIEYEKVVGSRVSETECKTKAEWAYLGIDVDELLKKDPAHK
jgi:hypothetical protein